MSSVDLPLKVNIPFTFKLMIKQVLLHFLNLYVWIEMIFSQPLNFP